MRSFGMVLALLKPALCIPAILAGFLRKPLKTMEALIAAAAIIVAEVMLALQFIGSSGKGSLFSVFARYAPADGAKNSFFVSGDYGVLNKLVKIDLIGEMHSLIILTSLLCVSLMLIYLNKRRPDIDNSFLAVISLGFVPVFTFHRSHDLVLLWPALSLMSVLFVRRLASPATKWFGFLIPVFCLFYRGSGGGMLYLYSSVLAIFVLSYINSRRVDSPECSRSPLDS